MSDTYTDLDLDLQTRWQPSPDQIAAADTLLAAGHTKSVYSGHLLVNKSYGFWTADVEIVHLDGLFVTRDDEFATRQACNEYVAFLAAQLHEKTGKRVLGGYSVHTRHLGQPHWSVWEDIMTRQRGD